MEIIHSCLGRSYLALGKHDKALENLSKAYHLFHTPRVQCRKAQDGAYANEYTQMLRSYGEVLAKLGQKELAERIAREAEESHIMPQ
jgi:tetratricopeptide (TPR) repeat protein